MKFVLTILCTLLFFLPANAQEEDNDAFVDGDDKTSVFQFDTKFPIPKRAALYSAILPGVGQIYNKQYWKLGLVGAGLGAAGYFIYFNNSQYQKYRNAYIMRIDNNPNTVDDYVGLYQDNDLNTLQNQYRQYLEYTVVFTTVGYALNILDAYVASNLRSFDISDDITLQTKPTFESRQVGLAFVFKLK